MFVYAMNLELSEMAKKKFCTFEAKPASGLFHTYFLCKSSFRVISMIKMVILHQSKPMSLYLKIKKLKILKFVNSMFIIHKYRNKTSIQRILKSNSTSFMLRNIFCEMKCKKVIHWGGVWGLGEWGNHPNCFLEL